MGKGCVKNLGGLSARDLVGHGGGPIANHYNNGDSKGAADGTVAAIGHPDFAIDTVGKVLKKPLLEIRDERIARS